MNAERLLEVYEQISEAPDAIRRMRRFVLDLAVRGKLVEQDAGDESASHLLEKIKRRKAAILEETGMRKPRKVADMNPAEIWADLPANWAWTQISDLGFISPRNEADDDAEASFVPMPMIFAEYGVANEHEVRPWGEIKKGYTHFAEGDVGLAKITPCFENGKSTVFRNLTGGFGSGTTELHVLRPVLVDPDYVVLFLKSPQFIETGIPKMTGTAGQKRVSSEYFTSSPFPLPPLPEQRRIVAKVDELMELCDRLEETRKTREKVRDKLTAATLARLTAPDTMAEDFPAHAAFALEALPALTTRPDQIKTLRQTILNLAVRGKLVEQDPADEPASELLAREFALPEGHERRRKIIKEAAVDASKGLLTTLPETWEYARIQDLYDAKILIDYADGNHGSLYPRKSEFGDDGVSFVSAKDLVNGRVNWAGCSKLNRKRASQLTKGWAQTGDVLLTHNATVGRVARVPEQTEPFLLGTSVTFYRLNRECISPDYFFLVLLSPVWQDQLEAIMAQTTRNQVSIQKQAFFTVPIPPLAEQHRIVAKVDALMNLCDQLEATLTTADTTRNRLLESLLHEALKPTSEVLEAAE